ncbi:hypothetical protein L345_09390, partial [Ophiophagus hannah]
MLPNARGRVVAVVQGTSEATMSTDGQREWAWPAQVVARAGGAKCPAAERGENHSALKQRHSEPSAYPWIATLKIRNGTFCVAILGCTEGSEWSHFHERQENGEGEFSCLLSIPLRAGPCKACCGVALINGSTSVSFITPVQLASYHEQLCQYIQTHGSATAHMHNGTAILARSCSKRLHRCDKPHSNAAARTHNATKGLAGSWDMLKARSGAVFAKGRKVRREKELEEWMTGRKNLPPHFPPICQKPSIPNADVLELRLFDLQAVVKLPKLSTSNAMLQLRKLCIGIYVKIAETKHLNKLGYKMQFALDKCTNLAIKRGKIVEDGLQLTNGNGINQLAPEEENNEDREKILIH